MEKAHKTDVVSADPERSTSGFVLDSSDPNDPRLIDRDRNIEFKLYLAKTEHLGKTVYCHWYGLHWHNHLIRIQADLWKRTRQSSNPNKFDYLWRILAVEVPEGFPETRDAITTIVEQAFQSYGYLYETDHVGTVQVSFNIDDFARFHPDLKEVKSVFEIPFLSFHRKESVAAFSLPQGKQTVAGFVKVIGCLGGGVRCSIDHQRNINLKSLGGGFDLGDECYMLFWHQRATLVGAHQAEGTRTIDAIEVPDDFPETQDKICAIILEALPLSAIIGSDAKTVFSPDAFKRRVSRYENETKYY